MLPPVSATLMSMPYHGLLTFIVLLVTLQRFAAMGDDTAPWSDLGVSPPSHLSASFGGSPFEDGAKITPANSARQPSVNFDECDGDTFYTLAMVDPDAPRKSKPTAAEWLHWLVVNGKCDKLSGGDVITSFNGPSPPAGSGPHRYALVLAKQDSAFDESALSNIRSEVPEGRAKFKVSQFLNKFNLEPIAGTYFVAEN